MELNLEKKLIKINYSVGRIITPRYIVIHETANRAKGADALAHWRYWGRNQNAKSSAHFVVDSMRAVQLGEFDIGKCYKMWHVGSGRFRNPIYNSNSIGIEICVNSDGDYPAAVERAIQLTRYVMGRTGIDAAHVVRHYDAWGKNCPANMLKTPAIWKHFKEEVGKKVMESDTNIVKLCRHNAQSYKKEVFL